MLRLQFFFILIVNLLNYSKIFITYLKYDLKICNNLFYSIIFKFLHKVLKNIFKVTGSSKWYPPVVLFYFYSFIESKIVTPIFKAISTKVNKIIKKI